MALSYNSLLASTIKYYKKNFVNNIIKDFILLAALGDKDLAPTVFKMRTPKVTSLKVLNLLTAVRRSSAL